MKLAPVLAVLLVFACNKSSEDSENKSAKPDPKAMANAVEEVNATVPEAWRGKLKFIQATDSGQNVAGLAPADWVKGSMDRYKKEGLGFMTSYALGTSCDGSCEPKDWQSVVAKKFDEFIGDAKPSSDDGLEENGRIVVIKAENKARVLAIWWKKGASHFARCSATLDQAELSTTVGAFAAACRATQVLKWN